MTICQRITLDYDDEMKSTRKLLERVPLDDAHRDYKPHPKSMALGVLATHVADIPSWFPVAVDQDFFEMSPEFEAPVAPSKEKLLEMFDANAELGRAALARAADDSLNKNWTFQFGELSFTEPRDKVLRSFINHLVHHRAQLGVYLRLNEIPIPGMYGSSADENCAA
jgi:uncharacterized damage-inducible protein DinB